MELPKQITGKSGWFVISTPIANVKHFRQYHESGHNGTNIAAVLKEPLDGGHVNALVIRGKDMPEFRRSLLQAFSKKKPIEHEIMGWTVREKILTVEELQ